MSEPSVRQYGWASASAPHSCGYLASAVVNLLKRDGSLRVLDLGAGNGALCAALKRAGHDVVGVEYSADGVAQARAANPDIPFYCYGVQDDPAALLANEGIFDYVVSTEVIEHLFSPHLLASYAHAVLRPGGKLLVTTPYHGYLKNVALALSGRLDKHFTALWHGGHIKFFSRLTLGTLLESEGFRVQEFHGVGRVPYLWKSMLMIAERVQK